MMKIYEVKENKRKYIDLLLLGDEQESMIYRYLDRGNMFVLEDKEPMAVCVVTDEGSGILEIKNLAVSPKYQMQGFGRAMIEHISLLYKNQYKILQAGTGDSPLTVPFYKKCGFRESHRIKNFFTDNYDHRIYECGVMLKDMVYFQKKL